MQTNKALLKLKDKTVIEIVAVKLKSIFNQVLISSNDSNEYDFLNLPVVNDVFIGKGPLAGIHSALKNSSTEKNFIISCDMPMISVELINYLIKLNTEKSILLPRSNGRIQQLCGIYSKSVIDEIENIFKLLEKDKNIKGSVFELLERVTVEFIDIDDLNFYNKNIFLNMNSPEDYELIKNIYENQ
jgi:molybdopterin-guanine dinucleotide biosynthesis protein A